MITYGVYSPIYFIARKGIVLFLMYAALSFPVLCPCLYVNICIFLDVCYQQEL